MTLRILRTLGVGAMVLAVIAVLPASTATLASADELPENVFATAPGDAIQDVLFLADSRPLFVRFHIRVGVDGFRTVWADFAGRLHRFLDGDGNGVLTLKEAQRGNWQQLLAVGPLANRPGAPVSAGTLAAIDANPRNGAVSIAELKHYLKSNLGYSEFGIRPGLPPDPQAMALFAQLDSDHDGTLSALELAASATDACIARLDLDEDELVSLAETKPFENPYADRFRPIAAATFRGAGDDGNGAVVSIGPGMRGSGLVQRLMGKYDRANSGDPKDGCLSCGELGSTAETFRRFDADGNGGLSTTELSALLGQPVPDIELNVALTPVGETPPRIELAGRPRVAISVTSLKTPAAASRSLQVALDGVELEFAIEDNLLENRIVFNRQFDLADSDKNGYVDKTEAMQIRLVQQAFDLADRDGDGKLFKAELDTYLDRQSEAIASRVMLTIGDAGRSLIEILDTDGDQKLGLRELRRARECLAVLDRDGDGKISPNEVPRHYRLAIGRGLAAIRRGIAIERYDSPDPPGRRGGPPWFEKMDRNRDGDVSVREFLGPRDQFRRFDADGDGLIDPREAGGKK
jgi:Ca2+-binding EF-hand superfamily protein